MTWERLLQKKEQFCQIREYIPKEVLESFDKSFDVEYAHNSTAIEGNTLTLVQTRVILEEGLSVGGKTLREIYEVTNHAKAFDYVKKRVSKGLSLDESAMKDIHALLMENILTGGVYRNVEVRISGAGFKPPAPNEMYRQVKNFFADLPYRTDLNPIELAAWTHAEFVKIHPFVDGNGRTGRLILNLFLMQNGYPPINVKFADRKRYYEAFDSYYRDNDAGAMVQLIAEYVEERLIRYIEITN